MRLQSKTAVVTGGGSGIGEACCMRFAEEGASVIVSDINMNDAERVAQAIRKNGGDAKALQLDVTQPEAWTNLADKIQADYPSLDILVNNAGIGIPGDVEECTLEDWRTTHAVNTEGVFLGTQMAIKLMKETGGSIINISSMEGMVGNPQLAAYNSSKGAVRLFTKSAALDCCNKGYPVRINSVHPGVVRTAILEKGLAMLPEAEGQALLSSLADKTPMGRLGQPIEIANACLFLASEESSYMTGSELVVDGGYTAQ
ncbi:glucose 1-dehydrogenase [Spongiibacter pelagi]|nr:glucose 1-dehydrogenase [Spongiibacter pelagi]